MVEFSFRNARPISEQFKDGIIRLIEFGAILENEKLPPVAELSAKYTINPKTIRHGLDQLVVMGYLKKDEAGRYLVAKNAREGIAIDD